MAAAGPTGGEDKNRKEKENKSEKQGGGAGGGKKGKGDKAGQGKESSGGAGGSGEGQGPKKQTRWESGNKRREWRSRFTQYKTNAVIVIITKYWRTEEMLFYYLHQSQLFCFQFFLCLSVSPDSTFSQFWFLLVVTLTVVEVFLSIVA